MDGTRKLRLAGILATLACLCLSLAAVGQQSHIPVIAGQDGPDYDACGSQGIVRGLDPKGDGFLAVRAGPSSKYAMVDKLNNGTVLNICDQSGKGGNWLGVVYSHETMDCAVGTPWPRAGAYNGPCLSGWVYRKFVADLAG